MKSKKGSNNYLVRVGDNRYESTSWRRFYHHVGTIKWRKGISAYLRVSYGMAKDNHGKLVGFYNDGEYTNKTEFIHALNAFLE
jgi:hypothetical protein